METLNKNNITGIAALLVHAAKIDEKYSDKEKNLIKDFIQSYLKDENKESILINAEEIEKNLIKNFIRSYLKEEEVNEILKKAEKIEDDSNQLISFTNLIKKNSMDIKENIIEHLWKVIISDNKVDQYESNLMRRICGLIYFPDKECAEIKLRLINSK